MNKKKYSPKSIKITVVLLILLAVIFLNFGWIFNPFKSILFIIAKPFQKTAYIISRKFSENFYFLSSISEIKKENENFIKENNFLTKEIVQLKDIRRENEELRKQMDLAPRKEFNLEASFVIGQDPEKTGSWILIDKGSNNGLREGMPVIVSEGILVGKISEAHFSTSKVTLLSDPSMAVNVEDLETGTRGIAKGDYGLGISMDLIEQSENVSKGDSIITSGLGGEVPRGLFVGKIQETKISEDKLFKQASILSRVRYSKLDVIFIIKGN